MGGNGNGNAFWGQISKLILPLVLGAIFTILGFIVLQMLSVKDDITELRVDGAKNFGELSKSDALHELTQLNLSAKIDEIKEELKSHEE